MAVYPNIACCNEFSEEFEDVGIASQVENGSQISRAKFTRSRGTYTFKYNCLSNSDYCALTSFFRNTVKGQAEVFDWTHPITTEVLSVRFVNLGKARKISVVGWEIEVTVKEA